VIEGSVVSSGSQGTRFVSQGREWPLWREQGARGGVWAAE
jgi:hypothetical protein